MSRYIATRLMKFSIPAADFAFEFFEAQALPERDCRVADAVGIEFLIGFDTDDVRLEILYFRIVGLQLPIEKQVVDTAVERDPMRRPSAKRMKTTTRKALNTGLCARGEP